MTFSSHNSSLIVRFLGFSHLLIALGSGACVIVTLKVLGIEEGFEPSATFISACTGLGYSIQRVIKANLFPKAVPIDRLVFLEKYGDFNFSKLEQTFEFHRYNADGCRIFIQNYTSNKLIIHVTIYDLETNSVYEKYEKDKCS